MTTIATKQQVRRRVRLMALLVLLCAFVAYGAALAGEFVFDDVHSVAANPAVQDLSAVGRWWLDPSAFSSGAARMYRPVLLTSFGLNFAISPLPWALKGGNVLLHGIVAVLLFLWLWRLGRRSMTALTVASLFAVHPLLSEAINLVSARSELLSTVGLLVALHAALSWQRGGGAPLLVLATLGTVIACGSKETGVVVPFLVAAQMLFRRRARPTRAGWLRLWLLLTPLVVVVLTYLVTRKLLLGEATVQLLGRSGHDPMDGGGRNLLVQLATMGTILPAALLQVVWPFDLSFDPRITFRTSFADVFVLCGWGSLCGLTLAACWPGRGARLRRLGATIAWLLAGPWIVVPLNQPFAEHRVYGVMVGLAAIVASLGPRRWHVTRLSAPAIRPVSMAVLGAVLLAFAFAAADRSLLYRSEEAMWRTERAKNPQSFRAWWGVGTCLLRRGEVPAAVEALGAAHALYPGHYDTLRNYTEALVMLPDGEAMPELALAIAARIEAVGPQDPWVRTLVCQAHLQAGRVLGDREHFAIAERLALSCLQIAEAKGYVYRLAAAARRGLGDADGALRHLDASLSRGLDHVHVRLDRAAVLRELGRAGEARMELLRAQRQAPLDPAVLAALQQWAAPAR